MKTETLDLSRFTVKLGSYATGPATAVADVGALAAAQNYRRLASARMHPIGKDDLQTKVPKAEYHASRKVDGEFTVLNYSSGQVFSINPGGTVRVGLPWMQEAAELLSRAGVSSARVAGELYATHAQRRTRVHDVIKVARGPESEEDLQRLRFAPFDIIEWEGQPPSESYAATFQTLESVFAKSDFNTPVETRFVAGVDSIRELYREWVEQEQAEGIVLRSDDAGSFKLKPRHTLDVVVVGFTEATDERQGMLHDLLVAVMRSDGSLQVLTRVGGGFSEEQRRTMLADLKDKVVESEYVEVNSDYVAYQMVEPTWIIEISCLDLISQTTRGGPVNRMVVEFDQGSARYEVVRRMPLATVISPQFVRIRDDKSAHADDVGIRQISERVEVELVEADVKSFQLPTAEMLKREVFTKVLKGETMVRKFVLLKTNKEQASDEFPAYVMHYTDFSPNRKDALQREVMVSSSEEQIRGLYLKMKDAKIKQGWKAADA